MKSAIEHHDWGIGVEIILDDGLKVITTAGKNREITLTVMERDGTVLLHVQRLPEKVRLPEGQK